jgi:outer membrane protein assembly factor BamB
LNPKQPFFSIPTQFFADIHLMFIRFLILAIFALPTTCNSDLFAQSRAIDTTSSAKTPSLWTRTVGEDWPRMLGAQYDSTSREKGIRKEWGSKGLEVVWAANTGEGYGNGVASQGRWFQFDRFGSAERLSCHHAETGEVLWKWEKPVVYSDAYGYNNGPRCSPVVDDDRVYVYGVNGTLACISVADGKTIWETNTSEQFHVIPSFFGVGASPLVYGDLLWVMVGGSPESKSSRFATINDLPYAKPNNSAMVAFAKRTGRVVHQVGNYLASYSAPVVRQIDGQDVCLAFVREGLLTFHPKDGSNQQFSPWRASILESVNAASPVLIGNKILIGETYEKGGCVIELAAGKHKRLWADGLTRKDQAMRPHWTTPLVNGNDVYVSSGRNEPDTDLRCVTLRPSDNNPSVWNPSVRWTIRNRDRMTGLMVDDHLVMLGESGTLQLLAVDNRSFRVISEMDLANTIDPRDNAPYIQTPSWAPPVLSHGLLYVRGANKVICLKLMDK